MFRGVLYRTVAGVGPRDPSGGSAPCGDAGELESQLRSATDLVVAEEDERIQTVGEERFQPIGPGRQLSRAVVVAAQPQVQEWAGPSEHRGLGIVRQVGCADACVGCSEGSEDLVDMS